jgi:DNA-binding FadR family transcriptional regulator
LTNNDGVECAFVIEARSSSDDRNFRLVTSLSEKDFREHRMIFSPEAGEKTFNNITSEQIKQMRQQCMQRSLGNFEITMIEEF